MTRRFLIVAPGVALLLGVSLWLASVWGQARALQAAVDEMARATPAAQAATLQEHLDRLEQRAEGLRSRVGWLRVFGAVPVLGHEARAVAGLADAGVETATAAGRMAEAARALQRAYETGEPDPATLAEAGAVFARASETLRGGALVEPRVPALHSRYTALVEAREELRAVASGGRRVAAGAALGLEALRPLWDLLSAHEGSLLHDGETVARVVGLLQERRSDLARAADLVDEGLGRLEGLPGVPEEDIAELRDALRFLEAAGPVSESLLGLDGTRRYLVLGQTADELRATGGFVSTVWVVTFHRGELAGVDYYDTVEVDDLNHLSLYPRAPLPLERHMQACCWLLRDVSWDPHFPASARLAEEVFALGQGRDVDGVVAINQWTLQRIVEFLEGIPDPQGSGRITPGEFQAFLAEQTDAGGRGYTRLLLPTLLEELERRSGPSGTVELARLVQELLETRQLMVYADDPETQALLEDLGWAGRVRKSPGDYLMVADSNIGWSKVDRRIERALSYEVALQPEGTSQARLALEYHNTSGPEASGCGLQWMSRGRSYEEILEACYWDYVQVSLPPFAELVESKPLPLPGGAIYAEKGPGTVGEDTLRVRSSPRDGKTVLEGLLVVPAGQRREHTFLYRLPSGAVSVRDGRLEYTLLLQPQAGVRGRDVEVAVTLPEGYALAEASPEPASVDGRRVRWDLDLTRDTMLHIAGDRVTE